MRKYIVLSPSYDYTEIILDDGTGPTYSVRAVVEGIEAETKAKAKAIAITMDEFDHWVDMQRGDNMNPFTGLECYEECDCWHNKYYGDFSWGIDYGLFTDPYCPKCSGWGFKGWATHEAKKGEG